MIHEPLDCFAVPVMVVFVALQNYFERGLFADAGK